MHGVFVKSSLKAARQDHPKEPHRGSLRITALAFAVNTAEHLELAAFKCNEPKHTASETLYNNISRMKHGFAHIPSGWMKLHIELQEM